MVHRSLGDLREATGRHDRERHNQEHWLSTKYG
jgi:hypothetical protein